MNEFISFLKDILMIKEEVSISIGLSQFKTSTVSVKPKEEKTIKNKEVKLSDLMRRNN